jgi:hypothetical protein
MKKRTGGERTLNRLSSVLPAKYRPEISLLVDLSPETSFFRERPTAGRKTQDCKTGTLNWYGRVKPARRSKRMKMTM